MTNNCPIQWKVYF